MLSKTSPVVLLIFEWVTDAVGNGAPVVSLSSLLARERIYQRPHFFKNYNNCKSKLISFYISSADAFRDKKQYTCIILFS